MSVFTEEDVAAMASEGNVSFNAKYLANYNTHDPMPTGADVAKLKDFIKSKYLDKRWFNGGTGSNGGGSAAFGSSGSSGFGAFDSGTTGFGAFDSGATGGGGGGKSNRRSVSVLLPHVLR